MDEKTGFYINKAIHYMQIPFCQVPSDVYNKLVLASEYDIDAANMVKLIDKLSMLQKEWVDYVNSNNLEYLTEAID